MGSFTKQVSAIFVVNCPLSSFCSRGSSWQRESLVIYQFYDVSVENKLRFSMKGRAQTRRTGCCTVNANP